MIKHTFRARNWKFEDLIQSFSPAVQDLARTFILQEMEQFHDNIPVDATKASIERGIADIKQRAGLRCRVSLDLLIDAVVEEIDAVNYTATVTSMHYADNGQLHDTAIQLEFKF